MKLYQNESSDPKYNAQLNLDGRTHYVDDNTLRFHGSRIITTATPYNGLLFALVESYAVDYEKTRRAFRPVIFDVFGNVIERPALEEGFKTSKQAITAMWDSVNKIDPIAITEGAIAQKEKQHVYEMQWLRDDLAKIKEAAA